MEQQHNEPQTQQSEQYAPTDLAWWIHDCAVVEQATIGGVTYCLVDVPPSAGARWATRNMHNRPEAGSMTRSYQAQMEAGEWDWQVSDVVVDEDGDEIDGQHRSLAVALCSHPVRLMLKFGVSRDVRDRIDVGKRRSHHDVAHVLGRRPAKLVSKTVGVMASHYHPRPKNWERVFQAFAEQHEGRAQWATEVVPDGPMASTAVWAVLAAASYTAPEADLRRFASIMTKGSVDGQPEERDKGALAFREWRLRLLPGGEGEPGEGKARRRKMATYALSTSPFYKATTLALSDYLAGKVRRWDGKRIELTISDTPDLFFLAGDKRPDAQAQPQPVPPQEDAS